MRRALLAALFVAGCGEQETASPAKVSGVTLDYSIPMGPEFARDPDVVSEDSRGEVWTAPGIRVASDFGEYGPSPDCHNAPCERLSIDGRPALLQRVRLDDGSGRLHLDVEVYEPWDTRLVVIAECDVAAACETLVSTLRDIEFTVTG